MEKKYTGNVKMVIHGKHKSVPELIIIHCPECYKFYKSSFSEQVIYYYIKQIFKDAISRYKYKNKHEIDIFIPSINLGIEYDGCYYHRNLEREIAKINF